MSPKKRARKKRLAHVWVILIALAVIALSFLALLRSGQIGIWIDQIFVVMLGDRRDVFYILVSVYALYRALIKKPKKFGFKFWALGISAFILVYFWTAQYTLNLQYGLGWTIMKDWLAQVPSIFLGTAESSTGLLGVFLMSLSTWLLGEFGTLAFLVISTLLVLVLTIEFKRLKRWFTYDHHEEIESYEDEIETTAHFMEVDDEKEIAKPKEKKIKEEPKTKSAATIHTIGNYALPLISLLDEVSTKSKSNANAVSAASKGKRLIEILNEFGVNAVLVATHIGPAVTKFEVRPDSNVKISKIASIQDNIKMELSAKELRIEAPIPGRNAVGVEIPNIETTPVRLIEMMREVPSDKMNRKLLYPLGKDLMGKPVYSELDKMPHLLVAGSTGSGKSVFVNVMITNFLLRTSPDELKLLLIDPKKVEFASFSTIPHLIAPVISDAAEAARALKIIVLMMENRYEVFSNLSVRNIQAYNELIVKNPQQGLEPMPWIVVIIDELADLMVVAGKDVESSIQRITQLARAAGIHLVVATQRPSTDVITGIIKANIPSRIAFEVSNGIDSRTILDQIGAERLLGKGDMLFFPVGEPAPVRVQGAFISDDEVKRVADAAAAKQKPHFDEAFLNLSDPEAGSGLSSQIDDPMYEEVKAYVLETGRASTSNLQRRFGLGYNRAARMIDNMEKEGIVGPAMGSKPRDVYKHN